MSIERVEPLVYSVSPIREYYPVSVGAMKAIRTVSEEWIVAMHVSTLRNREKDTVEVAERNLLTISDIRFETVATNYHYHISPAESLCN